MTEMEKLITALVKNGIPFELACPYEALQVFYPNKESNVGDVICHKGSFGYEQGLLEVMGLTDNLCDFGNVEGYLTADEVFKRIKNHWEEHKK